MRKSSLIVLSAIVALSMSAAAFGAGTFASYIFYNTGLKIQGLSGLFTTTIKQNSTEAADRVLNIPPLGQDDTLMTLGTAQAVTGAKTFSSAVVANAGLQLKGTSGSFLTTLKQNSVEAANRVLNIPALGADDTLVTLGTTQTVTGAKTLTSATVGSGGTAITLLKVGSGTLASGVLTVADTSVTANTVVVPYLTGANAAGFTGSELSVKVNAGVGFSIYSTNAADSTTVVSYLRIN